MRPMLCLALMLILSAGYAQARVVLSCAGEAGLRGYHLAVNHVTQDIELSIYPLISDRDELWIQRSPDRLHVTDIGGAERFWFKIAPVGLRLEIDNTDPPVVALRQFGIRIMADPCKDEAMMWEPAYLRDVLDRGETDPRYASERRVSAQPPLSSE